MKKIVLNKKKIGLNILVFTILALPLLAIGVDIQPIDPPDRGPVLILIDIMQWLFAILLFVAALALIIAGYFFITAAGDEEKTKKARSFVLYAIIGVLVAVAARGIVGWVQNTLGGQVT